MQVYYILNKIYLKLQINTGVKEFPICSQLCPPNIKPVSCFSSRLPKLGVKRFVMLNILFFSPEHSPIYHTTLLSYLTYKKIIFVVHELDCPLFSW